MIRSCIIYFVTLFFLILCFGACKQPSPQAKELQALHDTVMSIHDDVMPKIGNIRKLSKTIRKGKNINDSAYIEMNKRLQQEDDAMMEWMQQYDKPSFKNYEEAKAYLLDQKIKIEKVRNGMLNVIDDAEKLLKE